MQKNKICGLTEEQIRKYFFAKKIEEMIATILKESKPEESELERLMKFLEQLEIEQKELSNKLSNVISAGKPKEINLAELVKKRDPDEFKKWQEDVKKAHAYVNQVMKIVAENTFSKIPIPQTTYIDYGMQIAGLMKLLDEDRVYKDQAYRTRLTEIKDQHGYTRAEAEEYAKLTPEYTEYKLAVLMKSNLEEFINLCKKRSAENNYR